MKIKTDNGLLLGNAASGTVSWMDGRCVSPIYGADIGLNGFDPITYDRNYQKYRADRYHQLYVECFKEAESLQKLADARGKTIAELTEKFREKKKRIHEFYRPQLENRAKENEELKKAEGIIDYWFHSSHDWREIEGRTQRELRRAEEDLELEKKTSTKLAGDLMDAVQERDALRKQLDERDERLGAKLPSYRSEYVRYRDMYYSATEAADTAQAIQRKLRKDVEDLKAENEVLRKENRKIVDDTNAFIEAFDSKVDEINAAATRWEDGVDA